MVLLSFTYYLYNIYTLFLLEVMYGCYKVILIFKNNYIFIKTLIKYIYFIILQISNKCFSPMLHLIKAETYLFFNEVKKQYKESPKYTN